MTSDEARTLIADCLRGIAPEVDLDEADPASSMADELDLDSMDLILSLIPICRRRPAI